MMFDSMFGLPDDVVHRTMEVLQLCLLATAVAQIRPVEYMSHVADRPETFLFCLANCLGAFYQLILNVEIGFVWVEGQDAAVYSCRTDCLHLIFPVLMTGGATVYSAVLFYGTGSEGMVIHTPIIIMIVSWLSRIPTMYIAMMLRNKGADFKQYTVPMNIDFAIHRYGEWTMLMLGESVLSLLISNDVSDQNETKFYVTFYVGIISVTLLQFLYFKSQPHHADNHAMRRKRSAGFAFAFLLQIYSAALIVVGVGYKMLLLEYTEEYEVAAYGTTDTGTDAAYRVLAGGDTSVSKEERRQRIANLFCGGMAAVFITLDLLILAHNGIDASLEMCYCKDAGLRWRGIILVASRVFTSAFILTLSQYVTDPEYVALIGMGSIIVQVAGRVLGRVYFPVGDMDHGHNDGKEECDDDDDERWPNSTQPQSSS